MTFPIIKGRAEAIFGIHHISPAAPEMEVRARAAPWAEGTDGGAPAGALGVLADNASGYAAIAGAPPGHWSVTTELTLDVVGRVPADGCDVVASATLLEHDSSTGYSAGAVADFHGGTIAHIRQRGRYVPGLPESASLPAELLAHRDGPESLSEIFGLDTGDRQAPGAAELEVTADLVNPLGNLHGGIGLCLSEYMATEAFRNLSGSALRTTSVHVVYLRPAALGASLRVTTQVLHRGRRLGLCQVTVSQSTGKPILVATVTGGAE